MLTPDVIGKIYYILERADDESLRSYAEGWLRTIAAEHPAMLDEEYNKYREWSN
jgi:hypothetical protein